MRFLLIILLLSALEARSQTFLTSYDLPPGYSNNQLRLRNQLNIDSLGNKWIAFGTIGLGKFDGISWTVFDSINSGLPSDSITAIEFDPAGNFWVGSKLGATYYDGSSWLTYNTTNSGIVSNKIKCIAINSNITWFGTESGVSKFDGSVWGNFNTSNSGLVNDTVRRVYVSTNGTIWFATKQGLSKFDGVSWITYNNSNSIIQNNDVYDIIEDAAGRVWFCTAGKVIYFIDSLGIVKNLIGDFYNSFIEIGINGRAQFAKNSIGQVYFIISSGSAIFEINPDHYNVYYLSPNLPNGFFYGNDIEMDNQGHLWYLPLYNPTASGMLKEIDFAFYKVPPFLSPTIHNSKDLDINDVHTLIMNRGDMHWDPTVSSQNSAYEVPKGSGKHASYASALWIGGIDQGGNLHVAAQSYRQSGTDYWPGPISGISQPFDSASCLFFDKVYNIYKWQIEEFKTNFLNGSVSNGTYPVPNIILEWPAKGNGIITDEKAPFVDFNNDSQYNPYDGDYPLIKGDQMLFWMFNDSLSTHENTDPNSLGVEVHGSAYAYSCPGIADSNLVLNRTTLYHYRIINRSNNDYNNLYLGLWNSSVIGYFSDNYMGCDTTLAIGFAYNADNDDEITQGGYGLNPPMQNVVVLKGMLADAGDGIDNDLDGILDEPGERTAMNHFMNTDSGPNGSPQHNPVTDLDHYHYMRSIWLDGLHLTYGSDGRDPGNPNTNFMFPGTPFTLQWNEFTAGNTPEERKFVLGSGPTSLQAGGEVEIDFSYVFTWDSTSANGLNSSIARNIADVQRVKSWFDNDNFPSCLVYNVGLEEGDNENIIINAFPNPAMEEITITCSHQFKNGNIEVVDVTGRKILSQKYLNGKIIDISFLKDGLYFIRIQDDHLLKSIKFIKIH